MDREQYYMMMAQIALSYGFNTMCAVGMCIEKAELTEQEIKDYGPKTFEIAQNLQRIAKEVVNEPLQPKQ